MIISSEFDINNKVDKDIPIMSFFGKIKNMLIEKIVDDEFYQPITEHEIYSVINTKRESKQA